MLLHMLESATREKPVLRSDIMRTMKITDRAARKMVEALRENGVRVCSTSGGKGYWIAKTDAGYLEFRRDYISKATTILRRAGKMDANVSGQMKMEDAG